MGLQFQFQTVKARTSKMKAIILLFALAAVNAAPDSEAKPWWNTYGNTYGWNGMTAWNPRSAAYYGYWKREADSEAQPWWTYANTYGWNGMYNGWNNWYPRTAAYGMWKRDAEADSEAKPWWNTYASTYGWNGMYNGWNNWYPRTAAY